MRKHVVFVVDASRSMERMDVFDQGERKRRIDAVLDCCFEFIEVRSNHAYHVLHRYRVASTAFFCEPFPDLQHHVSEHVSVHRSRRTRGHGVP